MMLGGGELRGGRNGREEKVQEAGGAAAAGETIAASATGAGAPCFAAMRCIAAEGLQQGMGRKDGYSPHITPRSRTEGAVWKERKEREGAEFKEGRRTKLSEYSVLKGQTKGGRGLEVGATAVRRSLCDGDGGGEPPSHLPFHLPPSERPRVPLLAPPLPSFPNCLHRPCDPVAASPAHTRTRNPIVGEGRAPAGVVVRDVEGETLVRRSFSIPHSPSSHPACSATHSTTVGSRAPAALAGSTASARSSRGTRGSATDPSAAGAGRVAAASLTIHSLLQNLFQCNQGEACTHCHRSAPCRISRAFLCPPRILILQFQTTFQPTVCLEEPTRSLEEPLPPLTTLPRTTMPTPPSCEPPHHAVPFHAPPSPKIAHHAHPHVSVSPLKRSPPSAEQQMLFRPPLPLLPVARLRGRRKGKRRSKGGEDEGRECEEADEEAEQDEEVEEEKEVEEEEEVQEEEEVEEEEVE
ncbi:unnamed protein product [Closterium sp. Naga37s-1]|nr:unnamed protein product [Closterium sp. Naga37s-1]